MIENLQSFYDRELLRFFGKPCGCSEREVKRLEDALGFQLPVTYREFLRWMGKDTNGMFKGSRIFVDDIVLNRETMDELLSINRVERPGARDCCVFYTHAGYQAAWFDVPALGDDPPCSLYCEGSEPDGIESSNSFTQFMLSYFQGLAEGMVGAQKQ